MNAHATAYKEFYKRDEHGNLIFCGMNVPEVMKALTDTERGEPVYLVGTDIVKFQANAAKEALKQSDTRPTYAIKANSNAAVLQIIRNQGIGAEVASVEELKLALLSGFKPQDIVVDGIGKTREYFELAIDAGIPVINCNDRDELVLLNKIAGEKGKHPCVGIRVSPDVKAAGESHHISTGDDTSKFGVKLNEAKKLYLSQDFPNIDLAGIHCHLGSNMKEKSKFEEGYGAILGLVEELYKAGHKLKYVDMGGGVGVPYTPYEALGLPTAEKDQSLITIEEYGKILKAQRERLNKLDPNLECISELGRYYVAPASIYLCQVQGHNIKGDHTHITTTGNMGQVIRPALYQSPHIAFPMVERADAKHYGDNAKAVGNMCESDDIVVLDCKGMQKQRKGDYICIPTAGAYNPTMQLGTYNQIGTCGTILVHNDGKAYLTEHPVSGLEYMNLKAEAGALPGDLGLDPKLKQAATTGTSRRVLRVYDPQNPVPDTTVRRTPFPKEVYEGKVESEQAQRRQSVA